MGEKLLKAFRLNVEDYTEEMEDINYRCFFQQH